MGDLEYFLVRNCDDEVLGLSYRVLLGSQQKYVAWSTKWVQGWLMCGLGVFVVFLDGRLLRVVETKVFVSQALRRSH